MKGPVVENVVLTVHLILAVLLIGVVLLQRSEGGGLGMGSGGGSGVMTGRQAANALSRATWILAGAFLVTSLTLTVIAARNSSGGSIVDQLNIGGAQNEEPATNLPGIGDYTPPPAAGQPILPPVPGGAAAPADTGAATTSPVTPPAAVAPAVAPAQPAPATEAPAKTN
ncbi:preprotein translocase subunit SecG [Paracoccus litorisediminis]|jgi:preprotein translocase subunit SecG|uniref:Protein-export membrane protein SecG n=1 Tax=Paracoccus litorisediminis TaxID=2006130 RepID=A0A844HVM4_9RHOB|nr:preprotein translocase subunit SecG [Paracoccus litorisediminis]MTH62524.1 preprotein translocase subunit SecG [Paracoccus litorisediminis]